MAWRSAPRILPVRPIPAYPSSRLKDHSGSGRQTTGATAFRRRARLCSSSRFGDYLIGFGVLGILAQAPFLALDVKQALKDEGGNAITNRKEAEAKRKEIMALFMVAQRESVLRTVAHKLDDTIQEREALIHPDTPSLRIEDAWDAYVASVNRPDSGPRTLKGYEQQCAKFAGWVEGEYPRATTLADVGPEIAQDYAQYLSSLMDKVSVCMSVGWPMRTRLWLLGKSSNRSRSLRSESDGIRWASSMMGTSILPLRCSRKASWSSNLSQRWHASFVLDLECVAEDAQGVPV